MLAWLSVWSEVQTCIWPSWCHCHSLSLASVKSRLVLPFWYRLTWVVPDKGPLNGCVCVCVAAAARTAPRTDGRQRQMDMAPIRLPHGIPGPRNNTDCIIELYKTSNSQKLAYMVQLCKHHHNSEILPTRSAANSSSFSVMPQPITIWLSVSKSQKQKHNSDKLITYSNNNNTNNEQICIAP